MLVDSIFEIDNTLSVDNSFDEFRVAPFNFPDNDSCVDSFPHLSWGVDFSHGFDDNVLFHSPGAVPRFEPSGLCVSMELQLHTASPHRI